MTPNGDLLPEDLDKELKRGVREALEKNPEELREKLIEMGVLDRYTNHSDIEDEEADELTEPEELLLEFVETLQNPKSTQDIAKMIESERPELIDKYGSFKHRSWLSTKLNRLSKLGYIGKFRKGRTVLYTPDPKEAIRRWALYNDKFPEDLARSDADRIVADTGMDRNTVISTIREIQE